MFYEQVVGRKDWDFQRLVGVKREVYDQMLKVLEEQHRAFGRPSKLALRDQLLLCLMYWREYRSMAHIALTYGVSEPTVHRIIRKVETALLRSGEFKLPGKKALLGQGIEWQVVLIDATEVPIQRPQGQKNSEPSIPVRRKGTPSKLKS